MNEGDRMERLEARMARLEELVGALAGKQGSGEAGK
jgi:predicted ribonuclease toxin of YeeF-YezG toxin-antitoxin module